MLATDCEFETNERGSIESADGGLVDIPDRLQEQTNDGLEAACFVPSGVSADTRRDIGRSRNTHWRFTRRHALFGAVAAAFGVGLTYPLWDKLFPGQVSYADLMQAGPLPEQAVGLDSAPVTIIEYASMTCPHCANFSVETFPMLKERYVDTGEVRFIFREFPLDGLALAVSALARGADRDSYFPLIQELFRQQQTWLVDHPVKPLLSIATRFGFTLDRFKASVSDQKMIAGLEWMRTYAAERLKVAATPTFFINGAAYTGDMSLRQMTRAMAF
jgi:hypothetical protein